ncbi:hypothetical protein [Streptomyces sp. SCSIO ZS0520]|uniref:hypothetical protein n=1 Tax=Streptomyces sp. SCSIO ZS0520 TaxID=2892996 RepID=UPI0021DB4479|nr:hypothetical protein [Streptomyces sp. SCSIO ZS0520]
MNEGTAPAGGADGSAGGAPDLQVLGLKLIAQGITLALSELDDLTPGVGWSGAGRGFGELELSGLDLGHGELITQFGEFCSRWEWGVRSLIHEGNELAEAVGLSAGTLHQTDVTVDGAFKTVANAAIGDPARSEEEVRNSSWDGLVRDNYLTDPEWSGGDLAAGKREFEAESENLGTAPPGARRYLGALRPEQGGER